MRLHNPQGPQNTSREAFVPKAAVKPQGMAKGHSGLSAQTGATPREDDEQNLMEQVARENMKGAGGMHGLPASGLRAQGRQERSCIREELLMGTYKPKAVRRVEIPKPKGGVRLLGSGVQLRVSAWAAST